MKPSFAARLLVIALLAFAGQALAQAPVLGREYRVIEQQPTDTGSKIEVLEFFWYACPHCYALQPSLKAWLAKKPADVEFRRAPAILAENWKPLAQMYFALDALGQLDRLHHDVFAAIHDQKVRMNDPKVMADWVAGKGVDRQKFLDAFNSFAVQTRTRRAYDMTRDYDLQGTPTLVINGRYVAAPSVVLNPDGSINYPRYYQIVDQLIVQARKDRPAPAGKGGAKK
jgi:thiol:disulfide interchange protein DsbA